MAKVERKRKLLYKSLIFLLKIIPMLLAFCTLLNTALWFFGINLGILSYIGGTSLLPLLFIYIASYAFEFCAYHRMFLNYVVVNNIISIIDYYCGIGFGFLVYLVIAGIFLYLILYLHQREKKNEKCSKSIIAKHH